MCFMAVVLAQNEGYRGNNSSVGLAATHKFALELQKQVIFFNTDTKWAQAWPCYPSRKACY